MELQSAAYFAFLASVALAQWIAPRSWRVPVLLAASIGFYALGGLGSLVLLLTLVLLNYAAALRLARMGDTAGRRGVFAAIIALDLGVLIFSKYVLRLVEPSLVRTFPDLVFAAHIGVPLGISYFTFQMIACVTDAYRRDWQPENDLTLFALFGLFFPQITSGPIPRASRLIPQLEGGGGEPTYELRLAGFRLICYGLLKKYIVANRLTEYVSQIFDPAGVGALPHHATLPTLVGCVLNVLNLYADFSSYVDIAIGSALLLGVRLDPNFDRPFTSTSVTEFWRRWHMTLSFWLRDYLYLPLLVRIRALGMLGVVLALIATFAICGVWHDATGPYLSFGIAQGCAMSVELVTRRWRSRNLQRVPPRAIALMGWLWAMTFFALSEVLFRSRTLAIAGNVFSDLFSMRGMRAPTELFAGHGPFDFGLALVAISLWALASRMLRRDSLAPTPAFAFACGIAILFLGRLGDGHFIYAGF